MFSVWQLNASMYPDTTAVAPGRKRNGVAMPNVTFGEKELSNQGCKQLIYSLHPKDQKQSSASRLGSCFFFKAQWEVQSRATKLIPTSFPGSFITRDLTLDIF